MRAAMPIIYFLTTDGTKIAIPQEASEYSAVVRRALNRWTEIYRPPPPQPDDDDDDDICSTDSDSGGPPGGALGDDGNTNTSRTRTTLEEEDEEDTNDPQLRATCATASTDTDRTASFIDDDAGSRTPSPCPDADALSHSPRPQRTTPRRRSGRCAAGQTRQRRTPVARDPEAAAAATAAADVQWAPEVTAELLAAELERAGREDSATPSTLDEEEEAGALPECAPRPEHVTPVAHAHPFDAETQKDPNSNATDAITTPTTTTTITAITTPTTDITTPIITTTITTAAITPTTTIISADIPSTTPTTAAIAAIANTTSGGATVEQSPEADEPAPPLAPEEWTSPRSYHQRTPCMLGDDDDDDNNNNNSHNNGDAAVPMMHTPRGGSSSSSSNSNSNSKSPSAAAAVPAGPTRRLSAKIADAGARAGHRLAIVPEIAADEAAQQQQQQQQQQLARISDNEIVIELRNIADPGPLDSPRNKDDSNNHNNNNHNNNNNNNNNSSSSSNGNSNDSRRCHIAAAAVKLCAEYLSHFANGSEWGAPRPAAIPAPLDRPLVALLSEWETNFLYCEILGQSAEQREAARGILKRCPKMDFLRPTPHLRMPGVAAALVVDIPAAERVALLMDVTHTAEVLQIATLHAMCVSWCADYITRVSYSSADSIEAAALMRKCFSVKNDWTRKEMDCLRLENEWPINEEE